MKYLSQAENARRLEAYGRGLSDREMAAELGITYNAAYDWRTSRALPSNTPKIRRCGDYESYVPMEQVLTPDQCDRMRAFLGGMISLTDRFPGKKLDVMQYMKGYREAGLWGDKTITPGAVNE